MYACKSDNSETRIPEKVLIKKPAESKNVEKTLPTNKATSPSEKEVKKEVSADNALNTAAGFVEITADKGFAIDIKYATTNNFTKKQIYPCGRCYLRPEAASKLNKANEILNKQHSGWRLKMFDCYRPRPAQQRLWDVVPNPDYVTPPNKGSMHNRALAVDLTIENSDGVELNMGTPYDYFGVEAHMDYTKHSQDVNKNRSLLKSVMQEAGFSGIRTEWWHFSLKSTASLADWEWPCNK